jgi:hypothetical protein
LLIFILPALAISWVVPARAALADSGHYAGVRRRDLRFLQVPEPSWKQPEQAEQAEAKP